MKPKKLIRSGITSKLKEGEWETITDKAELNKLYAIKVIEELKEIQASDHKDIMEFVDLIQVVYSFAYQNGFTQKELNDALVEKSASKGVFGDLALNNLNPENPSNKLYFSPSKNNVLEYIHEFAWMYGRYYHLKDADAIFEKIGEKLELPEDFLGRVEIL